MISILIRRALGVWGQSLGGWGTPSWQVKDDVGFSGPSLGQLSVPSDPCHGDLVGEEPLNFQAGRP